MMSPRHPPPKLPPLAHNGLEEVAYIRELAAQYPAVRDFCIRPSRQILMTAGPPPRLAGEPWQSAL